MQLFNPRQEIDKTRHKLPHWQQGEVPLFITFRLADSLPQELLEQWSTARDQFLEANPPPWDEATEAAYHGRFSDQIDDFLDAGLGCCALRKPPVAQIVADRLHYFDAQRYDLWAYVVMPNHVHVLVTIHGGQTLPETTQAWKGVSSRLIHRQGHSTLNPFWQPDYRDRLIRSPEHFTTLKAYIRENPTKAHLRQGTFLVWERPHPSFEKHP